MRSALPRLAGLVTTLVTVRAAAAQTAGAPRPLSLAQAVREATQNAPGVQLAGYQVDAARARAGETRADLLPTFSIDGTWLNRSENLASFGLSVPGIPSFIPPFDNWDARVRLSQTVFDYAGWQRLRAQGYQTAGSLADRSAAAQAAARTAGLAYLAAVRASALLGAREQDSSLAAELLSLAQAQLQAGVSAPLDVTRARTELVAVEGDLITARNQRRKADIALALALGEDPTATYALDDTLSGDLGASPASADTAAAFALALERRPDLAAESARGAQAATERRAIATERLPRVDFAADYGPNGLTVPSTRLTQDVAVVVSIPLLDGFRRESRGAEQAAAERASDTRADDLRRQIRAQVRGSLLDLETGREQQAVAGQRLALAEEELSEARDRFASGVAGNIDVINAQAALNLARDVEIDSRYTTAAARVVLAYAAGVADTVH
jgi:outer membrane protein